MDHISSTQWILDPKPYWTPDPGSQALPDPISRWMSATTLLLQQRILPLEVIDVLLVCMVFPAHVLDVLCGFVQDLGPGCLLQ